MRKPRTKATAFLLSRSRGRRANRGGRPVLVQRRPAAEKLLLHPAKTVCEKVSEHVRQALASGRGALSFAFPGGSKRECCCEPMVMVRDAAMLGPALALACARAFDGAKQCFACFRLTRPSQSVQRLGGIHGGPPAGHSLRRAAVSTRVVARWCAEPCCPPSPEATPRSKRLLRGDPGAGAMERACHIMPAIMRSRSAAPAAYSAARRRPAVRLAPA